MRLLAAGETQFALAFCWRADSGTILRAYWEVCRHRANPVSIQSRATIGPPVKNSRPSSPVRQDGERQTTFLAEYSFRRVPFLVSAHFTLYSDFIQSAKIYWWSITLVARVINRPNWPRCENIEKIIGSVCWQPVVTSKKSSDNRLAPAKSLLTTSCIFQYYCILSNLPESSGILNTVLENFNKYWKDNNEFIYNLVFYYRKIVCIVEKFQIKIYC